MKTSAIWGLAAILIILAITWNVSTKDSNGDKLAPDKVSNELFRVPATSSETYTGAVVTSGSDISTARGEAEVPSSPTQPKETRHIAALRRAGRQGDLTKIPALMEALKNPHPAFKYAAAHSLAQMGVVEALPVFDSLLKSNSDSDLHSFLQAARARLLAERGASKITNADKRAQTKLRRFLAEANLSVAQLTDAPAANEQLSHERLSIDNEAAKPLALYMLRELADMIYQKRDASLSNYAQAQGVRFGFRQDLPFTSASAAISAQADGVHFLADTPSALKAGLGLLSDQERTDWLIAKLSKIWVMNEDTGYAVQLAIDQGVIASRAAAAKLRYMREHRSKYQSHIGFTALLYVIAGVGDREPMPLVKRFLTDSDKYVVHYARIAYADLQSGAQPTYGMGY